MADYPIITDVTYAELVAMVGGSTLEPGCSYLITDFATVHWMVDSDNSYIRPLAPAPTGITITPDAVGDNPVTYYYRVTYGYEGDGVYRSLFSAEGTYTEGDSTTESLFSCDAIPEWATYIIIYRGTVSGTYDEDVSIEVNSGDIFNVFGVGNYLGLLAIPIYQDEDQKIINTGATEPLLVTATSTNTIAKEVHSATYPDDIIHYEHDIASLNTLKQFYDSDLTETVTGFKGAITWRNDTKNNLQMSWDWRNIKHRLWNIKQPAWEAKAYAQNDCVTDNLMIYWAKLAVADVAEVYTVTLTGTNGTASITGIGGLTKVVTFAEGGTQDLTQTAADFVTAFAEDYAESGVGVLLTQGTGENGADLIFTSDTAGVGIVSPVITPSGESDDDLDGTVVHTTANYSVETEPKDDTSGRWINLQITADQYICYSQGGYSNWQYDGSIPIADLQDYIDVSPFGESCVNIVLEQNKWFDYMTFESYCGGMTFGSNCNSMTFGSGCYNMTFGSGCYYMSFGSSCYYMTFGSNCYSMTFGSGCGGMTFGSNCYSMTFGSDCNSMTFGSYCNSMTFGSNCSNMTFESGCYGMTFGSNCYSMTFGSYCGAMTFGSGCYNMTFESGCGGMTFGSGCSNMTFESGCYNMTFESDCYSMTFPVYSSFNDFKDGVNNIDFTGVGITQITTGITVTHQRANNGSAGTVQSYLNWVTDHYEMVYSTNKIGVFID